MNYPDLIPAITNAHQQAQAVAASAVNRHLILCNWLIGVYLVEFEKNGEDRAEYGVGLIHRLAKDLKSRHLTGLGASMLRDSRAFYRLSWTHLLEILRLGDPWKRAFYENECLKGTWSVRQLQRQIGSLLYERTGLSTDKETRVDYATAGLDQQLFVSRYLVALPSTETLQRLIEEETTLWQQNHIEET